MTENNVQDVNFRKLYCKRIGMSNKTSCKMHLVFSKENTKGKMRLLQLIYSWAVTYKTDVSNESDPYARADKPER